MKNYKNYMGFRIPKVWQILKHFAGVFRWVQTSYFWRVTCYIILWQWYIPVVVKNYFNFFFYRFRTLRRNKAKIAQENQGQNFASEIQFFWNINRYVSFGGIFKKKTRQIIFLNLFWQTILNFGNFWVLIGSLP